MLLMNVRYEDQMRQDFDGLYAVTILLARPVSLCHLEACLPYLACKTQQLSTLVLPKASLMAACCRFTEDDKTVHSVTQKAQNVLHAVPNLNCLNRSEYRGFQIPGQQTQQTRSKSRPIRSGLPGASRISRLQIPFENVVVGRQWCRKGRMQWRSPCLSCFCVSRQSLSCSVVASRVTQLFSSQAQIGEVGGSCIDAADLAVRDACLPAHARQLCQLTSSNVEDLADEQR